ncbi:zinc ribbon domain-containing protein [Lactococcus formosensis]|uniref:zinc ribbon domain-containing protein n=1 Tax=Lactococcus formosensis TaxID=1281486 RepID=UPI00254D83FA|nr:zinc ribbon domain-containing protein [Lactococcus formosensis]
MKLLMTDLIHVEEVDFENNIDQLAKHLDQQNKKIKNEEDTGSLILKAFDEEGTLIAQRTIEFPLKQVIEAELDEFYDLERPVKKEKRGFWNRKKSKKKTKTMSEVAKVIETPIVSVPPEEEKVPQEVKLSPEEEFEQATNESALEVPKTYIDNESSNEEHLDAETKPCGKCGKELAVGAKFCTYCGENLSNDGVDKIEEEAEKVLCISCHKELPEGTGFCPFCGAKQDVEPHIDTVEAVITEEANHHSEAISWSSSDDLPGNVMPRVVEEVPQEVIDLTAKVKTLSKRSDIEQSVKEKYDLEYQRKLQEKEAELTRERDTALYKAELDFNAAQEKINSKFEKELSLEKNKIHESNAVRIQQEVENRMTAQKEHIAELGQSFITALLGITEKM